MNGIARHRINTELIGRHWDDLLRVAGSLKLGAVSAHDLQAYREGQEDQLGALGLVLSNNNAQPGVQRTSGRCRLAPRRRSQPAPAHQPTGLLLPRSTIAPALQVSGKS